MWKAPNESWIFESIFLGSLIPCQLGTWLCDLLWPMRCLQVWCAARLSKHLYIKACVVKMLPPCEKVQSFWRGTRTESWSTAILTNEGMLNHSTSIKPPSNCMEPVPVLGNSKSQNREGQRTAGLGSGGCSAGKLGCKHGCSLCNAPLR